MSRSAATSRPCDNLRLAHGRSGVRRPGELRQVVFGHRALDRKGQAEVRDMVLRAFAAGETRQDRALVSQVKNRRARPVADRPTGRSCFQAESVRLVTV